MNPLSQFFAAVLGFQVRRSLAGWLPTRASARSARPRPVRRSGGISAAQVKRQAAKRRRVRAERARQRGRRV